MSIPFYEEDYVPEVNINIHGASGPTYIHKVLSKEEIEQWNKLISDHVTRDERGFMVLSVGSIRIWLSGFTRYVGPPERHPELKYQKP